MTPNPSTNTTTMLIVRYATEDAYLSELRLLGKLFEASRLRPWMYSEDTLILDSAGLLLHFRSNNLYTASLGFYKLLGKEVPL